ncbi:MAG: hypothetical protein K0B01_05090 [Syntrophobacterales bacterium]|nr:hypothetical protein [Syntrophobacterales bacterium]
MPILGGKESGDNPLYQRNAPCYTCLAGKLRMKQGKMAVLEKINVSARKAV